MIGGQCFPLHSLTQYFGENPFGVSAFLPDSLGISAGAQLLSDFPFVYLIDFR